jgi:hypothetical protein
MMNRAMAGLFLGLVLLSASCGGSDGTTEDSGTAMSSGNSDESGQSSLGTSAASSDSEQSETTPPDYLRVMGNYEIRNMLDMSIFGMGLQDLTVFLTGDFRTTPEKKVSGTTLITHYTLTYIDDKTKELMTQEEDVTSENITTTVSGSIDDENNVAFEAFPLTNLPLKIPNTPITYFIDLMVTINGTSSEVDDTALITNFAGDIVVVYTDDSGDYPMTGTFSAAYQQ